MTDENEIGDEWNHIRLREDEELDFFTELALHETERWIQAVTRKKFPYPDDFRRSLSNGILLCELLNELKPGTVKKINKLPGAIAGLDNVNVFLNACEKQFGLTRTQLFDPSDLEDLTQRAIADEDEELLKQEVDRRARNVAITIFWLGKSVTGKFNGPILDTSAFSALVYSHGNKNIISDDCFKNESWQQTENLINQEKSNSLLSPNTHHNRDSSYDSLGSYGPESDISFDDLDGNMPVRSDMRGEMKRAESTGSLSRDQPLRLPSNSDSVFDRYDPRYGSSPDISNVHTRSSSTDSADGFNHSRQSSGSTEGYPTRRLSSTTRKTSTSTADPLQFVKASKADDLAKSAMQQMEASKVVNKMRPTVASTNATEDQDWQSNFDSWKSKRRKSTPAFQKIGEAEGLFKEEEESQERKTKTFSQIMAEKSKRKSLGNLNSYPFDDDDSGFGSKSEPTITKSTNNTSQSQPKKKSKKADIAPWARNSSDEGDSQSDSETNNSHQSGDTDSVFSDKSIPKVLSDDDSWVKNKTPTQTSTNINRFMSPRIDKPISESKKLWENSVQETPKRDEKKMVDIPNRSGDRNIKNIKNAFEQKEKEANAVPEISRRPNRLGSDRPWKSMDLTNMSSSFSEKPPSPMSPKSPPALAPRESRVPSSSQPKYGSLPRDSSLKQQESMKDRLSGMTSPGSRYSDSITNPHLSKSSFITSPGHQTGIKSPTSRFQYGTRSPTSPVEHQSKDRFASARSKFEFLCSPEEPKPIIRRRSLKERIQIQTNNVILNEEPKKIDPPMDKGNDTTGGIEDQEGVTMDADEMPRLETKNMPIETKLDVLENYDSKPEIVDSNRSYKNTLKPDLNKGSCEDGDIINMDDNFGDISEGSDTLTADSGVHLDKIVDHIEETEAKLTEDSTPKLSTANPVIGYGFYSSDTQDRNEGVTLDYNDLETSLKKAEDVTKEFSETGSSLTNEIAVKQELIEHLLKIDNLINADETNTVNENVADNNESTNEVEASNAPKEDLENFLSSDISTKQEKIESDIRHTLDIVDEDMPVENEYQIPTRETVDGDIDREDIMEDIKREDIMEDIDIDDIIEDPIDQPGGPLRNENEIFTEKTIKISQKPNNNKGFGFALAGGMEKRQPVTITRVNLGSENSDLDDVFMDDCSAADVCEVEANDELITINGRDVSSLTLAQVQGIVDHSVKRGQIELRVKRYMDEGAYDSVEEEETTNLNRIDTQSSDASSLSTDLTSEETYRPVQKIPQSSEDGSLPRLMDQLIGEKERETNNNISKITNQDDGYRATSPVIEPEPIQADVILTNETVPKTEVVIDLKQDETDSQRPELRRDMSYPAEEMIIEERKTISVSNKTPEKESQNVITRTMTPQKQYAEVKTVESPGQPTPPKVDPPQLIRSTEALNTSTTSDDSSSSSVGPPAALLRWQRPRTKSEYKNPFQKSEEQIKAAKGLSSTLPWQSDNKISLDDYSKDDSMMNKVAKSFEETISVSKPVQSTYNAYRFDDADRLKAWDAKQEIERKPEDPYNSYLTYPHEEHLTAQNEAPPSRKVGQVDLPDLSSLNLPVDDQSTSPQEKFEREQRKIRMEYEEEKRKREKLKQEEEKAKLDSEKLLKDMDTNIHKTKQEATVDITATKSSPLEAKFSSEPLTFKLPSNSPARPLVIDPRNQGDSSEMKDDSQPEYVFQVGLPKTSQPLHSLTDPPVLSKEDLLEQERQKIREEEKRRVEEEQKQWRMEQEREFKEQQEKLRAEREKLQQEQERIAREKAMLEQERLQPSRSYQSYSSPVSSISPSPKSPPPALDPKYKDNKAPPPTAPKPSRGEKARLTRDDLLAMNRSAKPLTKRPEGQEQGHSQDSLYGSSLREPPSKGELHSLNAVPKQKVRGSGDWMNNEDKPFVIGKRSDLIHKSNNSNPQDHWLVQEAERRRKQEQLDRRNNYDSTSITARAGPTKPSESSLVSRFRGDIEPPVRNNRYSGSGLPTDLGLSSRSSNSSAKYERSPDSGFTQFNAKTQPNSFSSPSLSNTLPANFSFNANTSLPSKPPKSPYSENEPVIAVSGKQKCSHCGEELGFGAAMVIETLGLYYHVQCFRCCVCRTPLGNGAEGADVRVRVNKLHCKNCYSNDEAGLKFSKV